MPRVRYTADGGHYRVAGVGFDPGDERDVDAELADYLTSRDDFEPGDDTPEQEDEPPDDTTGTDDSAGDEDDTEAGGEAFDIDEWLDQDYSDRADRVRDGEVDAHLDEIDAEETSGTVRDAIGERRAELETTEG